MPVLALPVLNYIRHGRGGEDENAGTRLVELAQRIRADDTFRREAVRLAKSSTKPVTAIARELGIGNSTLYRWMARYADANPAGFQVASSRIES